MLGQIGVFRSSEEVLTAQVSITNTPTLIYTVIDCMVELNTLSLVRHLHISC